MNPDPDESEDYPRADEMYCPECGSVIKRKAEICPECGVRIAGSESESSGPSAEAWAVGGLISFVVGVIILAIVFGPITIFAGYMTYRKSDGWFVGSALILGGILELTMAALVILPSQMMIFG